MNSHVVITITIIVTYKIEFDFIDFDVRSLLPAKQNLILWILMYEN